MTNTARHFCRKALRFLPPGLALFAAVALTPCAAAADPVTYEFTGTVVSANDLPGISVGMSVTGTYTFDYANSDPAEAFGTIGSTAPQGWVAKNSGGAQFSTPAPTLSQYVFSSTVNVGSVTYSTDPGFANGYWNSSSVSAGFPSDQEAMLYAQELSSAQTFAMYLDSYLQLKDFGTTPWAPDGLPVFIASAQDIGGFEVVNGPSDAFVNFHIDTLQQLAPVGVPTPGTLALLPLGALFLWVARTRRTAAGRRGRLAFKGPI